jgi:hypothetical protein
MAKQEKVAVPVFESNAWLIGVYPGGFSDRLTGIHVPGPIVNVEGTDRRIVGIASLPNPVRIPRSKVLVSYERARPGCEPQAVRTVVDFCDNSDQQGMHDGLRLAVLTGTVRVLTDAEVQRDFPEAWEKAQREGETTFDPSTENASNRSSVDMLDLARKFREAQRAQREGAKS